MDGGLGKKRMGLDRGVVRREKGREHLTAEKEGVDKQRKCGGE